MELKDIIKMFTSRKELQILTATQMQAILDMANTEVLRDGRIKASLAGNNLVISHEERTDGHETYYWVARRLIK